MILNNKVNDGISSLLIYLIAFTLILDSGSMYVNIVGSPISNATLKLALIAACILMLFKSDFISLRSIIYGCITLFLLIIYILATFYNIKSYAIYSIVVIVLFIFWFNQFDKNNVRRLLNAYSQIIIMIASISLIFWTFGSIFHFLPKKPILYIWGREYAYTGYSYWFLYFENPVQAAGRIIRNTGIFTEAPGYVDRLLYALCIELFNENRRGKKLRVFILIITLITTLSSKAYILLLFFGVVYWVFFINPQSNTGKGIYIFISSLVSLLVLMLFRRILGHEMSTASSSMTRIDHLYSGFMTWLQYPLFGAGYSNTRAIALNHLYASTPEGASMGIATFLAEGGLYMFCLYLGGAILSYYCINKYHSDYKRSYIVFLGAIMINWFISNVAYTTLMISIVCMGYAFSLSNGRGTFKEE